MEIWLPCKTHVLFWIGIWHVNTNSNPSIVLDGQCRVRVVDGWLKKPHLLRVTLIGLWGWVKLHTCRALSNQCAQVIITTHTQEALLAGSTDHHLYESLSSNSTINRLPTSPACVSVWRSPQKPPRWRVAAPSVVCSIVRRYRHVWINVWIWLR